MRWGGKLIIVDFHINGQSALLTMEKLGCHIGTRTVEVCYTYNIICNVYAITVLLQSGDDQIFL